MDRNQTGYRSHPTSHDSKSPFRHDHVDYLSKDQDTDRFDSGIDSYVLSCDSVQTSGYGSHVEEATTHLSSLSLTSHSATSQSTNVQGRQENFDKPESTEERLDSGVDSGVDSYMSRSIQYEDCPKKEIIQDIESSQEELEDTDILRWYLPDSDGDTYLHLAIFKKELDIAFNMIQRCNIPQVLDIANKEEQTALHISVITDQPEITRCLVAYGADIRCKDKQGNTPLHLACEQGLPAHVEMLTAKLDPDEDPGFQKRSLPQNVNERNYLGFTPLHLAVNGNHVQVVNMLTKQLRCDVDIGDLRSGRTALHHAVERRSTEIIAELLKSRADVNALTYDECSPLHLAAARGLRKEAHLLLEHGADLFLITRDDDDVFELAENSLRLYKLLRDAERKYKERRGPLHLNTVMG